MKIIFIVFFFLTLLAGAYFFRKVISIAHESQLPVKGIFKFYVLQRKLFSPAEAKNILLWAILFSVATALPWFFLLAFYRDSDHSFWLALYPLVWIYVINRVLLFERSDLMDSQEAQKK